MATMPEPAIQLLSDPRKPKIIGLYGISGCGKTTLLNQLREELGEDHFNFYDGSDMLSYVISGSLQDFQAMEDTEKCFWRKKAIEAIAERCKAGGKTAIVAGHLMFWNQRAEPVYTDSDLEIYTHIIYLHARPEVVAEHRKHDDKKRPNLSIDHLAQWQSAELCECHRLCLENSILFTILREPALKRTLRLIRDVEQHDDEHNLELAQKQLDETMLSMQNGLQTMLVLDGDKTLAAQDTGNLFWKTWQSDCNEVLLNDPLETLFSSPMGYSYTAFRQATMLYETVSDEEYEDICEKIASEVSIHSEFVTLLRQAAEHGNIGAVVLTCGLRRLWEKVLERERLDVKVIGGGRVSDDFVVTAAVKERLVITMKDKYKQKVWVFGDSPLDLPMMRQADRAIVVVGDESSRSKSMEAQLSKAIKAGLRAHQVLLPSTVRSGRLNANDLPFIQLNTIIPEITANHAFHFHHATDKPAAKLLMTPTRNANISGPSLREAHSRIGWYLATEYLSTILGTKEYSIPHVTGGTTTGHHILHESRTTIVALMRGGEPMALGVSDALPTAMFVHAKDPADLKLQHIAGQATVVLVDSVINTGKSVIEFLEHIRAMSRHVRIVVVAGVVQGEVMDKGRFDGYRNVCVVVLRRSEMKFVGRGGTDTGNRLFNTVHLE